MTTLAFALDGDYIELKSLLKLTDLVSSGGEAKVVIDLMQQYYELIAADARDRIRCTHCA